MLVAKEGFEITFQNLTEEKTKLLAEKEAAMQAAREEVDAKFVEREKLIDEILTKISYDFVEPELEKVEANVIQINPGTEFENVEQVTNTPETNNIFDEY